MIELPDLLHRDRARHQALVMGHVVAEGGRCVQCGICSFYCPISIDVRRHAWLGEPIAESHCLTCGECVARCPRGVLRFERTDLFPESRRDVPGTCEVPGTWRPLYDPSEAR